MAERTSKYPTPVTHSTNIQIGLKAQINHAKNTNPASSVSLPLSLSSPHLRLPFPLKLCQNKRLYNFLLRNRFPLVPKWIKHASLLWIFFPFIWNQIQPLALIPFPFPSNFHKLHKHQTLSLCLGGRNGMK